MPVPPGKDSAEMCGGGALLATCDYCVDFTVILEITIDVKIL
jgi:hypothetical protein